MVLEIKKSNFGSHEWLQFPIWLIMTLYYKVFLLQNATVLLQIATVITKYIDFIKKCDSYYKMRRLLQNALVHTFKKPFVVTIDFKDPT